MSTEVNESYMSAAVAAANAASRKLMSRFESGVQELASWQKSPGALVTEADIESDQAIAKVLLDSGCGGVIISEESNVDLGSSQTDEVANVEWLIDPLCGTVPFSTGMNHWGVNIAMRADGDLALSALSIPTSGMLLTAQVRGDVKLNGKTLQVEGPGRDLGEATVGLEIDGQDVWRSLLASGGLAWVARASQINSFASAAYPLMLVATGRMSAVVFYRIEPMHVAAGSLAATMLGAMATDGNGEPIDWARDDELPMVVVGWPRVHGRLIDEIKKSNRGD